MYWDIMSKMSFCCCCLYTVCDVARVLRLLENSQKGVTDSNIFCGG